MTRLFSLFIFLIATPFTQAANIFVSVPPLVPVLKALDTDNQVESLVTAGYSPATYSPTPRQLVALSNAAAVSSTGVEAATVSRRSLLRVLQTMTTTCLQLLALPLLRLPITLAIRQMHT